MTISHFDNNTASRFRASALLLLASGMFFIGCGSPPAPQVKKIVAYAEGVYSTQVYSYTNDGELKRLSYSYLGDDTEDHIFFTYRDGRVTKLEYHDNVSRYRSTLDPDIGFINFVYAEDQLTGLSLSFSEDPDFEMSGKVDYNSDDLVEGFSFQPSVVAVEHNEPTQYSFEYTEDSLFEKVTVESKSKQKTTHFEYNSEDLISEITHFPYSGMIGDHEYSYNDDGQLVEYGNRFRECDLSYNEDDLVEEISCTYSEGFTKTYEVTYNQGENVEGVIPRMPGIGFGDYFSLDGRPLTPETFTGPLSLLKYLIH